MSKLSRDNSGNLNVDNLHNVASMNCLIIPHPMHDEGQVVDMLQQS